MLLYHHLQSLEKRESHFVAYSQLSTKLLRRIPFRVFIHLLFTTKKDSRNQRAHYKIVCND